MWSKFWHTLGQLKTVNLWYLWIFSRGNPSVEIGSDMVPSVFNCISPVPSTFHCWTEKAAGITTITSGFHLRHSETLRSMRHYQWAHSQWHRTINCLEETGVQRGSTWWLFSKDENKNHCHQSDQHWSCFKGKTVGTCEKVSVGLPEQEDIVLNWPELSWRWLLNSKHWFTTSFL